MNPFALLQVNPVEFAQALLVFTIGIFLVYVAVRNFLQPFPFGRPAASLLLVSGVLAVVWQTPTVLPFGLIAVRTADVAGVLFFVAIALSVLVYVLTSFSTRLRDRKATLDTLERQRTELAVAEAHLRSVLEHAPDHIATVDRSGRILSINNLPGSLDPATAIGRPVHAFFNDGSAEAIRGALHRVFAHGATESLEAQTLPFRDQQTWYSLHLAPLLDQEGAEEAILIGTDVTKRLAMEQELREERERYATLADAAFEGILLHKDDLIIDANGACADILGYERDELVGLRLTALVPGEDAAAARDRLLSPREGKHPGRLVRKDGKLVQVEVHRREITLANEPVLVSVLRDVSIEFEARRKDRTLRALFGHADDAIFILGLEDGRVLDCNPAAAQSLGTTRERLLGREMASFARTATRAVDWPATRRAVLAEGSLFLEGEHVRQDGSTIPIEVSINPIGDDPELGELLVAVARDVTARKRAQDQLVTTARKLRTVIEATNDGLLEWDLLTDRVLWTKRLPGMEESDADPFGPSRDFVRLVHPEDRTIVTVAVAGCHDGTARTEAFRVRRKGSGWLWTRCSMTPIQDSDGRVVRIVGAMQDITAEKREERLREAMERLREEAIRSQESNRLKSEFLANMSHELRTPLNVIIGFADLLASGKMGAPATGHGEFIDDIRRSGQHLLQIINDVLDLAKVEAGKMKFTPEETRLDLLLEDVRETLKPLSDRRSLIVEVDAAPEVEQVVVDPTRLRQVVYNYVTNAIKFSNVGGTIRIQARPRAGERFEIAVEDKGIGIAEKDIDRLFLPFEQLDAGMDKQYQGTGLGLALTRRIVEEMGGTVGVVSTVGEGSRFHAVLPMQPRPTETTVRTVGNMSGKSGPYVLMVSDSASGTGAARLLVADGFKVDMVQDPMAALKSAAKDLPTVLVLDIDVVNVIQGDALWHAMEAAGDVALVQWTERASSGGRLGEKALVVAKADGPEAVRDAVRRLIDEDRQHETSDGAPDGGLPGEDPTCLEDPPSAPVIPIESKEQDGGA